HEHVEMAVAIDEVQGVIPRAVRVEMVVTTDLAFRKETHVVTPSEKRDASIGLRRIRGKIIREIRGVGVPHQVPMLDAAVHLSEKGHGTEAELLLDPFVRVGVQIRVAPERWLSNPVDEARIFANRVVTFMMRATDEQRDQLGDEAWRVIPPLGV